MYYFGNVHRMLGSEDISIISDVEITLLVWIIDEHLVRDATTVDTINLFFFFFYSSCHIIEPSLLTIINLQSDTTRYSLILLPVRFAEFCSRPYFLPHQFDESEQ